MIWHRARARGLLEDSVRATRITMPMRAKGERDVLGKEKGGGTETDTQVRGVKWMEASMKSALELRQLQSDPRPSLDGLGACDPHP